MSTPPCATRGEPLLTVDGIETFYGSIQALKGVSFKVPEGSIVTLLGANGAGKSTTLKCISGLVLAGAGHGELPRAADRRAAVREDRAPRHLARPRRAASSSRS